MLFLFPFCLVTVARNSSICWVRELKVDIPLLFPIFRGALVVFAHMMLAMGLPYMTFIVFMYVPSIHTLLRVLIINGCWILSHAFSASVDMTYGFYVFMFLFMWWITFIDLWMLYRPCSPRINPTWSCCVMFSLHCCIQFANILLRILASMFISGIDL